MFSFQTDFKKTVPQNLNAVQFEEIIKPHLGRIYSVCLRLSGNRQDADDMAQEALLRIYRNLSRFRGEAQFGTWVWRVTTNVCLDRLRTKKRTEVTLPLEEDRQRIPDFDTPEQKLESKERIQAVSSALCKLKAEYRIPVVLRDVEGKSYEEIAKILRLNSNTVKSRILRGRTQLRALLKEEPCFSEKNWGSENGKETKTKGGKANERKSRKDGKETH